MKIAPFHGLTLLFLVGLSLLTFYFRRKIPSWDSLLFRYALWIGFIFVLKSIRDRKIMGKIGGFIHDFSPIFFVVFIYQSLGDMIQHLQSDIDPWLIELDSLLFGIQPTIWMQQWITHWFTDLMSFAYGSYYFLPVILIATLRLRNLQQEFNTSLFVLTLGYYVSFIGYILFPAIGPRYTLAHLYTIPLEGSFLTDLVRDGLNAIEHNKRDVMPSGHTQIALMVLFLAYRYQRSLFYLFLPIICGLVLSTVYLRYHYVVDLFAGALIAVGCTIIGLRLHECWDPGTGKNSRNWKPGGYLKKRIWQMD